MLSDVRASRRYRSVARRRWTAWHPGPAERTRIERITGLMRKIFDNPIATITFIDGQWQWFASYPCVQDPESDRTRSATSFAKTRYLVIGDSRLVLISARVRSRPCRKTHALIDVVSTADVPATFRLQIGANEASHLARIVSNSRAPDRNRIRLNSGQQVPCFRAGFLPLVALRIPRPSPRILRKYRWGQRCRRSLREKFGLAFWRSRL